MNSLDVQLDKIAMSQSVDFAGLVPVDIAENLNSKMELRPYQREALGRFIYYRDNYKEKKIPIHLLFQMATGSGKTLVMAGLMLHLYKCGYRRFLFFVNSNNIIEKTRDNFLNEASLKYLFSNKLNIGGKPVRINEVENFQWTDNENISIIFTTVQALHSRLHSPKENSFTIADLTERPLILLSDEAHHINVQTKRAEKENDANDANWENTILNIFTANKENILLEFTATANLFNQEIAKKYRDKLIFDYSLKSFRQAGYSKEVKVLQTMDDPLERALIAVLLSQYRKKLFADYGIYCKPVILFKSKTIAQSHEFFDIFRDKINMLSETDIRRIRDKSSGGIIVELFSYLQKNKITLTRFVQDIRSDFSKEQLISINSKEESEEKQLAINNLEHPDNPYRVVFAVDKLNEGWDVLNLFDIVRLYDSPHTAGKKINKTTVAEAQLIGRGARYFPFYLKGTDSIFKRKFDEENHPLKLGETLYYHSLYNPAYIHELHTALVDIGIQADKNEPAVKKIKPAKKQISKSLFPTRKTHFPIYLQGYSIETEIFTEAGNTHSPKFSIHFQELGARIIQKAFYRIPFYHFDSLKHHQTDLTSLKDLSQSPRLKLIWCDVYSHKNNIHDLSPDEKLNIAVKLLLLLKEKYLNYLKE